ncbi:MFS transporter [Rhodobacteraceae bacterium CCMM004]|nr:MFS transporter [Rhodobacteraceae bacterium CCMM004]
MMAAESFEETLFEALTEDTDDDGGLTPSAAEAEPGNFLRHAAALSMTKLADGLLDPKLVLSWLLTHLGAGSVFVGLLVPIREAGALLPQLLTAPRIRAMARRKWAWAAGSAVQGAACAAIVAAGLTLSGAAAGIAVCAALAVLALARSVCSVSYKDVLGKTVGKARRGSATGLASSVAAAGVVAFALLLLVGSAERYLLVVGALTLAAALWLVAGAIFATLREEPTPGEVDGTAWGQLRLLREDPQLVRLIAARGLLTATALAPPYLVLLGAGAGGGALEQLGALVLASAAASFLSSYVWGRLADRSSRTVLSRSGSAGAAALAAALALDMAGLAGTAWAMPVVLFGLMIAYHGVRQGRSTYLVDMAPADLRTAYTAVSNTVIGLVLLGSGVFGALAALAGPGATLALFAAMCLGAVAVARGLDEVEEGL